MRNMDKLLRDKDLNSERKDNAMKEEIKLGATVRDKISGFVGVVTGRCEYLNGCVQFQVSPTTLKDGDIQKSHWLDIQQLEVTEAAELLQPAEATGGPQDHAPENHPPEIGG